MTAFIVFFLLFVALGVAVELGATVDSRDPEYGLGPIVDGPLRRRRPVGSAGGMRP